MTRKPFILAVTSQLPWPLDAGGHLRSFHILRMLARTSRVRLIAGVEPGSEQDVEAVTRAGIEVRPVLVGTRTVQGEAWRMITAALRSEPYALYRRHDRRAVHAAIRDELAVERPRAVYLDHLDSFVYGADARGLPLVVDMHNVYSVLVAREATEPKRRWFARRYLARQAELLEKMERRAVAAASLVFSVSDRERAYFAVDNGPPVVVVPNGVDCSRYEMLPAGRAASKPIILFIGTMSWPPNIAAARFLATRVLPEVQRHHADAELRLVGRSPGREVLAMADGRSVSVLENVPDVRPYLESARVLAVPLQAGGGTRLKILEAFAAGVPVVSTAIGCEGLEVVDRQHLVIAEASEFAAAVHSLLADRDGGEAMARRARLLVEERYDWEVIGTSAISAIESVIPRSR